jgi:acyl-CoA thioesterase
MQFSEILASLKREDGQWAATASEDWQQGRSLFGGLQAALAVKAMRDLVPDVPLRSLQTTFLAPVPAGTVTIRAQILRSGKSATHVEARIVSGEQVLCLLVGIFGASRPSKVERVPQQPAVPCDKPRVFPYIEDVMPAFTRHFTMTWRRGGMPYSGATQTENVLELGFKTETGAVSDMHVLALADVIPPIGLSLLKSPVAGSSMTWTIEFLIDQFTGLPLQGWRMDAEMVAARDGYTSQSGLLWAPDGRAVALSCQNMVIFG